MICIGVTGHRFLGDIESLTRGVHRALGRVEGARPGEPWAVISSLAEGADRLVVRCAFERQPSLRLVVPLPLMLEDYLQDFSTPDSRNEFLELLHRAGQVIEAPTGAARPQGYALAGRYMLEHSQVLVALWDGQAARGLGGTGEMVALARRMRLPMAWVRCCAGLVGRVSYQRFKGWQIKR